MLSLVKWETQEGVGTEIMLYLINVVLSSWAIIKVVLMKPLKYVMNVLTKLIICKVVIFLSRGHSNIPLYLFFFHCVLFKSIDYIYLISATWLMYLIHYKWNSKCCLMSFYLFNIEIFNFLRKLVFSLSQ